MTAVCCRTFGCDIIGNDTTGYFCIVCKNTTAKSAVTIVVGFSYYRVSGNNAAGHNEFSGIAHFNAAAFGSAMVSGNSAAFKVEGNIFTVDIHAALTAGNFTGVIAAGVFKSKSTAADSACVTSHINIKRNVGTVTGNGITVQVQSDVKNLGRILQIFNCSHTGNVTQQGYNILTAVSVDFRCKTIKSLLKVFVVSSFAVVLNFYCVGCSHRLCSCRRLDFVFFRLGFLNGFNLFRCKNKLDVFYRRSIGFEFCCKCSDGHAESHQKCKQQT